MKYIPWNPPSLLSACAGNYIFPIFPISPIFPIFLLTRGPWVEIPGSRAPGIPLASHSLPEMIEVLKEAIFHLQVLYPEGLLQSQPTLAKPTHPGKANPPGKVL